jgi:sulfopyruvate decarboxylase subunit beta
VSSPDPRASVGSVAEAFTLREAVAVVRDVRGEHDVVIPSMGAAREWMALGPVGERDFVYVPSAMGHATSLGLGLALAQPHRRVIVLSGDGSLLMNLGSLVTIAAESPANLVVIVFDNGVYEVTGAQPTPGAAAVRAQRDAMDFVAVAHGCGLTNAQRWTTLADWRASAPAVLADRGPTLAVLDVVPTPGAVGPRSPGGTLERAQRFIKAVRE